MESKHTPGPWSVHRYDLDTDNGIKVTTADIGRRVIAEVKNPDNAALIAAAPDMYEALRMMVRWGDEDTESMDDELIFVNRRLLLAAARAALAKATA